MKTLDLIVTVQARNRLGSPRSSLTSRRRPSGNQPSCSTLGDMEKLPNESLRLIFRFLSEVMDAGWRGKPAVDNESDLHKPFAGIYVQKTLERLLAFKRAGVNCCARMICGRITASRDGKWAPNKDLMTPCQSPTSGKLHSWQISCVNECPGTGATTRADVSIFAGQLLQHGSMLLASTALWPLNFVRSGAALSSGPAQTLQKYLLPSGMT